MSGGVGHRQRYAEDGVGPQVRLVGGAVQLDQPAVDGCLVVDGHAEQGRGDDLVDVVTALRTPSPPKRALSPSRSSTASYLPVLAPEGTAAHPGRAVG